MPITKPINETALKDCCLAALQQYDGPEVDGARVQCPTCKPPFGGMLLIDSIWGTDNPVWGGFRHRNIPPPPPRKA